MRGVHTGTVSNVNLVTNEILIDIDAKNQGLAPADQFEPTPGPGDQVEVFVERYDEQLGLYKLLEEGRGGRVLPSGKRCTPARSSTPPSPA